MNKRTLEEGLDKELKKKLEELNKNEIGTEAYTKAADAFCKLHQRKIEETKTGLEVNKMALTIAQAELDAEKAKLEMAATKDGARQAKKDRWIKIGLGVLEIGVPAALYAVFMNKGFKFEETGTYTSATLKNMFGRLKANK